MKKGKVFGKGQLILALMVVALGAAVWLNMRFSSPKYFGEATYVDSKESPSAVETSAKAQKTDYFESARDERAEALEQTKEEIEGLLDNDNITDEQKQSAVQNLSVPYNSITVDSDGFVYVTSDQVDSKKQFAAIKSKAPDFSPVKKLNSTGAQILNRNGFFDPAERLTSSMQARYPR